MNELRTRSMSMSTIIKVNFIVRFWVVGVPCIWNLLL